MNRMVESESQCPMTCPRLSIRQLLVATMLVTAVLVALPMTWKHWENFEPDSTYRIPFVQSDDYWLYRRLIDHATGQASPILVIGDSVVWGEYVAPDGSLTSRLNRRNGSDRFINGGVNGLHPMAMEGLIGLHGTDLRESRVILHCNLLWLSSAERDLSSPEPQDFNHSNLVAQFGGDNPLKPPSPSYDATLSERTAIATTRRLPYRGLVEHIRSQYFGGKNIHRWTLDYPREPFWREVNFSMTKPVEQLRHAAVDWTQQGIRKQSFEWLAPAESLQFAALLRTIDQLQATGNDVFVIVGPFNIHLLTESSKMSFHAIRQEVAKYLAERQIPHVMPRVLPSELYGDASHPLESGYLVLAEDLLEQPGFRSFCDLP